MSKAIGYKGKSDDVRHVLREGDYELRVFHPRYGVETRQVQVQARQTSEVRIGLMPRAPAAVSPVKTAPSEGAVKRFFRKLFD